MAAPANAVRFFGAFTFLTPADTGLSMRNILALRALRSARPVAQAVHIA